MAGCRIAMTSDRYAVRFRTDRRVDSHSDARNGTGTHGLGPAKAGLILASCKGCEGAWVSGMWNEGWVAC
jgi:hypothetical protein